MTLLARRNLQPYSMQVPTFRANPLTPACDGWCEFPVSDRPNAVAQFFQAAEKDPSMIKVPQGEKLQSILLPPTSQSSGWANILLCTVWSAMKRRHFRRLMLHMMSVTWGAEFVYCRRLGC